MIDEGMIYQQHLKRYRIVSLKKSNSKLYPVVLLEKSEFRFFFSLLTYKLCIDIQVLEMRDRLKRVHKLLYFLCHGI